MALTTEERKKASDRLTELAGLYNKYYWANQAQEEAARAGKGKSGFPPELSAEIGMLNNVITFGTPYNALIAQAAADRQASDAITASQNSGGGLGSFLASIDPTTAISKAVTNVLQPVEQTISTNLAQLDKDLSLSQNAPLIATIAATIALPGVGASIGNSLLSAGLLPAGTTVATACLLYTSPSPRDGLLSRMPSSA